MVDFSPDDFNAAVQTVAGEAANQPAAAQAAVASTILNRASILGKPIAEIASDPATYNGVTSENAKSAQPGTPLYKTISSNIAPVFKTGPTTSATHFYSGETKPAWDNGTGVKIGDQVFLDRRDLLGAKTASAPSADEVEAHINPPTPVSVAPLPPLPGVNKFGEPLTPSADDIEKAAGFAEPGAAPPNAPAPIVPKNALDNVAGFLAHVNRGTGIGDELAAGFGVGRDLLTGAARFGTDQPGNVLLNNARMLGDTFNLELQHQRQLEAGFTATHPNFAGLGEGLGMAGTVAGMPGAIGAPNALGAGAITARQYFQGSRLGNMARGGVTAALTGAGFAATDAGTPEERLAAASKAVTSPLNMLGVAAGAFAPTAPKAVNALTGEETTLPEKIAAFDQAGVRPSLAAVGGKGAATTAQVAASNALVGGRARNALTGSISDTEDAASRIAQGYGEPLPRASAGEAAQAAVQKYAQGTGANLPPDVARMMSARDLTFGDKANALYTRAERLIGDTQHIAVPNTTQAINDVMSTFDSPALAQRFKNNVLEGIGKDIASTGGQITWRDAKNLRTQIRMRLMGDPQLSGTVNDAQVSRIYQGLTQDMRDGAAQLGGPEAARAWDQANTFYRAGRQQIDDQLGKIFNAHSGEQAYDTMLRWAGSKGGADISSLLAAKRAMGDGWGDLAATAAQRLGSEEGKPFSVDTFVTNYYNKLSPSGRDALFGSLGGGGAKFTRLRAELDNLANVASMQKGVEAAANHSNTYTHAQTGALGVMAAEGINNPHSIPTMVGGIAALGLTGEAMTNPMVVRALAKVYAAKTPQAAQQATLAVRELTGRVPRAVGVYSNAPRGTPSIAPAPSALAGVSYAQ